MAARSLLLKLEAQGQIELPSRRAASVNGLRNRPAAEIGHDQSLIQGQLDSLQSVRFEPLAQGSPAAALFRFLLQRYHYLGLRNCVGQNLKYLARDGGGRVLRWLLFGWAAWKVAARDCWIGWKPEQRQRHLFLLTNNTRFLILPWVRVPHLASHLLGRVAARLSADWHHQYGHPIHLVETFVERDRFQGTCYRAAGWVEVGLTTGRSRNHKDSQRQLPTQATYLKALMADFPRRL